MPPRPMAPPAPDLAWIERALSAHQETVARFAREQARALAEAAEGLAAALERGAPDEDRNARDSGPRRRRGAPLVRPRPGGGGRRYGPHPGDPPPDRAPSVRV